MLNPSDGRQRNTLVDLAWLLITLYFVWSIIGFRNVGCQQAPPPMPAIEVHQHDFEPVDNVRPSGRKVFQ